MLKVQKVMIAKLKVTDKKRSSRILETRIVYLNYKLLISYDIMNVFKPSNRTAFAFILALFTVFQFISIQDHG